MGFQFSGRIGGFILPFRLKKEETSSPQSATEEESNGQED